MKILFVDTTSSDLVVAVIGTESIDNFSVKNCGTRHSETLCLCVQNALEKCGLTFADLDAYACTVGPGSFTGIRIGISTIKGYALAKQKPLIAISSLEATAYSLNCERKLSAVLDAGNGYYFADYKNNTTPCVIAYDDDRAKFAGHCESAVERLDGAAELIRKKFSERNFDKDLTPIYIRRSQAEER